MSTFKAVKVKTGGRKYVIRLCFPKSRFEKNAFEVDDGETLLFSQARLHKIDIIEFLCNALTERLNMR